jgi:hypothetical protein
VQEVHQYRQNLTIGSEPTTRAREIAADAAVTDSAKLTVASFRKKPNLLPNAYWFEPIGAEKLLLLLLLQLPSADRLQQLQLRRHSLKTQVLSMGSRNLVKLFPSLSSRQFITYYYLLVSIVR